MKIFHPLKIFLTLCTSQPLKCDVTDGRTQWPMALKAWVAIRNWKRRIKWLEWWFPSGYNTITSKESNLILIIHFQSCYKYTFYLPRIWLAVELLDCAGYCKCYLEVVPKHTIYLVFASFVAIYNAVNTNLTRLVQIFRRTEPCVWIWMEQSYFDLNYTVPPD